MGISRGVRKGRDLVAPKPFEVVCGLQKIIIFLIWKSTRVTKGHQRWHHAKELAVMHTVAGDLGPSTWGCTGPRGQAMVGGAELG